MIKNLICFILELICQARVVGSAGNSPTCSPTSEKVAANSRFNPGSATLYNTKYI
ncbi:hypothetical protein HanXRQr2_Chr10g0434261 [Helianthus annuus]|uniref:Uncharacterized protein n=1 Tax=Helianthus annuus TaxID=4232 RepID=A0A9K3N3G8_HELAN|nr:hypothetical protein HanXRQr2_Chr10g0434261 [Helianthus annuus]